MHWRVAGLTAGSRINESSKVARSGHDDHNALERPRNGQSASIQCSVVHRSTQTLGVWHMASQTFRASSSAYVVLCGPWLLIAALWTYASYQAGQVQYGPIAICVVAAALFGAWLAAFRLVLTADTFAYRSLFGGTRRAHYSDV